MQGSKGHWEVKNGHQHSVKDKCTFELLVADLSPSNLMQYYWMHSMQHNAIISYALGAPVKCEHQNMDHNMSSVLRALQRGIRKTEIVFAQETSSDRWRNSKWTQFDMHVSHRQFGNFGNMRRSCKDIDQLLSTICNVGCKRVYVELMYMQNQFTNACNFYGEKVHINCVCYRVLINTCYKLVGYVEGSK